MLARPATDRTILALGARLSRMAQIAAHAAPFEFATAREDAFDRGVRAVEGDAVAGEQVALRGDGVFAGLQAGAAGARWRSCLA